MQPTPEQHDAIHIHDKNLIVVAGAGSGKTRVLVERYLQLLEQNPDWKLNSLVAITFTREAAFEMKNRVRIALEANVANSTHDQELGQWAKLLSQMDTARIDTIHGLCVTILRANAAQAGIDPKFEVLDETDAVVLLEDAVSDVLQNLDPALSVLFSEYDSNKILDILTTPNIINTDFPDMPDDPQTILDGWHKRWSEGVIAARNRIINSHEADIVQHPEMPYPPDDKLGELAIWYCQQLDELSKLEDAEAIFDHIFTFKQDGAVGTKGSAKIWGSKEIKDDMADRLRNLRDRLSEALDYIGDTLNETDEKTAQLLPLWHKLLTQVQTTYRQLKREQSLLDFDDLERLTAQLLQHDEVKARYRNAEFKHLLVDEFQDTNQLQWTIIQALADLNHGGSLFVVGDPKQSIYQFRGADVSVFNTVRDQIANNQAGKEVPLSQSFRTHSRLVKQFNQLFSRLLVRDEASPVKNFEVVLDKHMTAFREESPEPPPIELLLLVSNPRNENGNYLTKENSRSKLSIPTEDMRRWEAYEIAGHINTIINEARPVFDKAEGTYRAPTYGDFAILFQSTSNINLYEDVFKSLGIPFMTVAGRGYYSRQEVWDILDLLRALHNPADNLSLATVLRSPMFGFSDDMLLALRLINDETADKPKPILLWDALKHACENAVTGITDEDRPLIQFALQTLNDLRTISGRVTISELIRQALAKTGYLAILTGLPDGARRRGNIEKLLDLAESSGKITLGKFSQYLADLTAREIREGEALLDTRSTVKLMTVHASKGLEFPVVILADTSWTMGGGRGNTIMYDVIYGLSCEVFDVNENKYVSGFAHRLNKTLESLKEDAERKRLLYVAATRAQDYLLISGQLSLTAKDEWSTRGWLKLLMEAFDITDIDRHIDQQIPFEDDVIRVMMPAEPPPSHILYADAQTDINLWDYDANPSDFPPRKPDLIHAINIERDAQIGHISATQLADLGGMYYGSNAEQKQFYRDRFRRRTLHDGPARVQDLGAERQPQVSPRLIGEIVHEAIRFWRFDLDQTAFNQMLEGYAWQRGLTYRHELDEAIRLSHRLLQNFQQSLVFDWIESARTDGRPLFTELPFILRTEKRVIHGVIDVLFQQTDGTWVVVDYKTSTVINGDFDSHARRYHLQIGVYASAVQNQLGGNIIPDTYIHYIRYNRTLSVPTQQWQAELDKLEAYIGELVASDD